MKYKPFLNLTIDSREQKPLVFNAPYFKSVLTGKLNFGDYSCSVDEKVCPIYFERKAIGDLFGTLSAGIERFKREVERAKGNESRIVIVVEGSYYEVLEGYKHSSVKGLTVVRTLFTLMIKYGIPFVCFNTREEMAHYISEFYYSYFKNLTKED